MINRLFIKKRFSNAFSFLSIESFAKKHRPFEKAKTIVQYFYYFLAFQALVFANSGGRYITQSESFSPVWSISWAGFLSFTDVVYIIQLFFLISAFMGAFFYSYRVARILVFLAIFQVHALLSSFVQVDHHWYPWLYVSFLLIFLPDAFIKKEQSLEQRKKFLLVFFAVQVVAFLTYSMSGFGKVYDAVHQYLSGEVHAFAPKAFALHLAYWLRKTDSTTMLGPFFIKHYLIGWPLFVGAIYLQFFSIWAVFKPSLHKIWAFGLILMHIGIFITINILFVPGALLLLLFFFDSPFKKPDTTWRETILDLPLFGWVLKRIWPRPR